MMNYHVVIGVVDVQTTIDHHLPSLVGTVTDTELLADRCNFTTNSYALLYFRYNLLFLVQSKIFPGFCFL